MHKAVNLRIWNLSLGELSDSIKRLMTEKGGDGMTAAEILILVGGVGLALTLIATPITAAVLRKKGKAIAQSIREEYEL